MNYVVDILVSAAGGVIANFITFFALQRTHLPPPSIQTKHRSKSLDVTDLAGTRHYEEKVDEIVISNIRYVMADRTNLHLGVSLVVAVIVGAILLWMLIGW